MNAEKFTLGVRDGDRTSAIARLADKYPRCSFCRNAAKWQVQNHLSPIFVACEGCYDAFTAGMDVGARVEHALVCGDIDRDMGMSRPEHLRRWIRETLRRMQFGDAEIDLIIRTAKAKQENPIVVARLVAAGDSFWRQCALVFLKEHEEQIQ